MRVADGGNQGSGFREDGAGGLPHAIECGASEPFSPSDFFYPGREDSTRSHRTLRSTTILGQQEGENWNNIGRVTIHIDTDRQIGQELTIAEDGTYRFADLPRGSDSLVFVWGLGRRG